MARLVLTRRSLLRAGLASAAALPLGGCDAFDFLKDRENAMRDFMIGMNKLTYRTQRLLQSPDLLAPEFAEADIRQDQHPNGSIEPDTDDYLTLLQGNFTDYQLMVDGLVERPMRFTLDALRAMPSRTQITRHDCVEGWSCIAKWQGTPLQHILDQVGVKPHARYVVFHCFDAIERSLSGEILYYESIDLIDARHPQTILAYVMNDKPLPVANGAPLRVRVERQLGYKMAKYIRRIELVSDFGQIGEGHGSYWADRGYEWYAGI
ncbi:molybdopterin-binding protein [Taklimakanibacter deserti]|uniref:molybdopterin-binding protein n=1 Tax=Taklimakanibacter deserti TaxID=2267839 RepID=UPI000E645E16